VAERRVPRSVSSARISLITALIAVTVLAACGSLSDDAGHDPTPELRSPPEEAPSHWAPDSYPEAGAPFVEADVTDRDTMTTVPETVVAVNSGVVVFPDRATRGPGFGIERRGDDGWVWLWSVSSDTDVREPAEPIMAERFREERMDWVDGPAFDSGDPHRIRIPDETELGLYRICTAPDQPALCAEVEVVEAVGLGRASDLSVETTDHIEIRQVLVKGLDRPEHPSGDEAATSGEAEADRGALQREAGHHASPFGSSAVTIGVLLPDDAGFADLLAEVAEVRRIDTGNVTYDLANPDIEVVLLDGDEVLARLGYYREAGRWGEYAVPGRWMDEQWRLLAMTTELPPQSFDPYGS
jgi:hypothetical protein